jgi:hypothetical protein
MSEIADGKITRKSRVSASSAGENLVLSELLRRGFDAQLGPRKHEVLVRAGDRPPAAIQVKAAHSPPWYVRSASLLGAHADDVRVLALLGIEKNKKVCSILCGQEQRPGGPVSPGAELERYSRAIEQEGSRIY